MRLDLGFLLLGPSLPPIGISSELSPPKAGVFLEVAGVTLGFVRPLLAMSWESLDSFSFSLMLKVPRFDRVLPALILYMCGDSLVGLTMQRDSLVPAVAEVKVEAKGLGLTLGVSCGCGGGADRWICSRST